MESLKRPALTEIGLLPGVHLEVNAGGKLKKKNVLNWNGCAFKETEEDPREILTAIRGGAAALIHHIKMLTIYRHTHAPSRARFASICFSKYACENHMLTMLCPWHLPGTKDVNRKESLNVARCCSV